MTTYIADRIAINPGICNGRPIIRGMRITVQTVLEFLFAGTPREEILHQYPVLEPEDIDACLKFAIELMDKRYIIQEIKAAA
ncbi:hypothetical protein GCM10027341_10110 [Spirosoma knui]